MCACARVRTHPDKSSENHQTNLIITRNKANPQPDTDTASYNYERRREQGLLQTDAKVKGTFPHETHKRYMAADWYKRGRVLMPAAVFLCEQHSQCTFTNKRKRRRKKKEGGGGGKCLPHTGRHATLCSALVNETPTVAAILVAISCVISLQHTPSLLMRENGKQHHLKGERRGLFFI